MVGVGVAHVVRYRLHVVRVLRFPVPYADARGFGGREGAPHGSELPLLFDVYDRGLGAELYGSEAPPREARELARLMRAAWIAFVRTGAPGWPGFDVERETTMVFDARSEVGPYPQVRSKRLWAGREFGAMRLHAAGVTA